MLKNKPRATYFNYVDWSKYPELHYFPYQGTTAVTCEAPKNGPGAKGFQEQDGKSAGTASLQALPQRAPTANQTITCVLFLH